MLVKMFTVYDSKTKAFITPFFNITTESATRTFSNASNDKEHQFGRNPEDYTLFEIGIYDDETAKITPLQTPLSLGLAVEYAKIESASVPRQTELKLAE